MHEVVLRIDYSNGVLYSRAAIFDERSQSMNLMLQPIAIIPMLYQSYLSVKRVAEWCDISHCVFAKIDDNNLVELFFDVDMAKLKVWLSRHLLKTCSKATILCQHGTPSTLFKFQQLVEIE